MEIGTFEIRINNSEIETIASHILGEPILSVSQVCERYGSDEEDVRYYTVYFVKAKSGRYVLKKTDTKEASIYTDYLTRNQFNVPRFYGSFTKNDANWICIEYVKGLDLREMTDELVVSAARSLSDIQTFFWMEKPDAWMEKPSASPEDEVKSRFTLYWKRILRRAIFVADNMVLRAAYQLFLDRQLTCPCTLSNGDFLEWNAISDGQRVVIIDWGFGGIMPYSLDIARFIAHATEDKSTFPFYMTEMHRGLFLSTMYEHLQPRLSYEQFMFDIKLALLNEYIEFVEADEDENNWYLSHALELAREILRG